MKKFQLLALLLALFVSSTSFGQRRGKKTVVEPPVQIAQSPKLVVGIVVDQMRYDYLTRFWNHYGEGGFKRLVGKGFNCKNHHFNYAPTSTGPGHASVYSGTTPAVHGIIGNHWYDKVQDNEVYCASDDSQTSVGSSSDAGKMSPHRMLTTTITDQLRLHTQKRGKVIDHNASDAVEVYKKSWTTLKPINTYLESGTDANGYEGIIKGEANTAFPHDLPKVWEVNEQFDLLRITPFGNSITTDFALAALEAENLGKDAITDFLAISFSSTDYVGHFFGVNSKEVQDTYLRLDQDLERILNTLDEKVGVGQYTVFLTADHGAIHVPAYLQDQKVPAGYLDRLGMRGKFTEFLKYKYGTTDVVKNISNYQVFLDHKVIANLDIDLDDAQEEIAFELLGYDVVDKVFTGHQMWQNEYASGIPYILQQGYNQKRSGDILFVARPGFISYKKTGSTHGSPMIYDTHVPLLFYGKGIRPGSTFQRTEIPDIAPTLATLLGIAFPNGTTGRPIGTVLE